MRSAYQISVGKPEAKRLLGSPRYTCEGIIKLDLKEVGCEAVDSIHIAQDRDQWRALVKTTMNIRVQ